MVVAAVEEVEAPPGLDELRGRGRRGPSSDGCSREYCGGAWQVKLIKGRSMSQAQKKMMRGVQRMLRDVGYDPGPIDGSRGGQTASALSKFQRDKGLEQTGTLNSSTLQALSTTSESRGRRKIRRRR